MSYLISMLQLSPDSYNEAELIPSTPDNALLMCVNNMFANDILFCVISEVVMKLRSLLQFDAL